MGSIWTLTIWRLSLLQLLVPVRRWSLGSRGTFYYDFLRKFGNLILDSSGVSQFSTNGAYVNFATTVGTANTLLNTTFMNFENAGVKKIRTTEYSVPESLTNFIDLIDPTVFLGKTVAAVCQSFKSSERMLTHVGPNSSPRQEGYHSYETRD
jgi:hypothetical protein